MWRHSKKSQKQQFCSFPTQCKDIRQRSSSQRNQHNGLTNFNQQKYRNCRLLRGQSGAIQAYQTSGHGNTEYGSRTWVQSDGLFEPTSHNERRRIAKQSFLVSDTRCMLDCSQAYHCLKMANHRFMTMIAFHFPSRTFAYRRLEHGHQKISFGFFKFHAWVFGPSCQSWPFCSLRGRFWDVSQQCCGTHSEHSSGLQVHSPRWIETDKRRVPFTKQKRWIPWQNQITRKTLTARSDNSKISRQSHIPQIKKGIKAPPGIREILQKLYSQDGWKT